jgi:hypothetical protein
MTRVTMADRETKIAAKLARVTVRPLSEAPADIEYLLAALAEARREHDEARDEAVHQNDLLIAARAVLRSLVKQHMGCPICSGPLWAEGVTHEAGCSLAAALGTKEGGA